MVVCDEVLFPVLQRATFWFCTHMASLCMLEERERTRFLVSCYKGSNSIVRALLSWPHLILIISPQRPHLQIPSFWASTYGFWRDTNILSIKPNFVLKLGLNYIATHSKKENNSGHQCHPKVSEYFSIKDGTSWVKSRMLFSFQSEDGITGFLALRWG